MVGEKEIVTGLLTAHLNEETTLSSCGSEVAAVDRALKCGSFEPIWRLIIRRNMPDLD